MDPLWYKDAIIYEVHVRAFSDSNGDGIGDFAGLTQTLPYLQDLGITCLWLLPFYPSPLRDDGYDIADYTSINPIYGTLDDFRRFVDEAHARHIRVLTELVVNHTSDQHPWFQQARQAPKGSPERDYYVWSDSDQKYAGTRIIFTDTEKSNWTYDPVAGQYYWHRFFSHQPDLNLDNPAVLEAIIDVMRFWFDLGVDAMRLDAIPYLIEREGTINENLPETHGILKQIRHALDAQYEDKVLLAEANQWPSDVRAYFGDGDECHMAFHFPLMPRMFMALRQEERHPIVEIMNQTPDIPDGCQWAIFLRNHDELTLEMVTDEERDYMYAQYATDPQMRINVGIRRRLAPLMENSRRRIELMNSLLFTMPGTPIIYYGDEIGMGDNVYLGDRNGVRTPMQWSGDRNGGFSRADPARLFAPVIMDSVYGYEAINVEAQERSPFSLLHWMKRLIALRKQHPVFGRGALRFIPTSNRKVLTYVRQYGEDRVLCVANMARTVQPAEIPLAEFDGLTPVEMTGQTEFPRIGEAPYFLTLAPYGFYWFQLQDVVRPITEHPAQAPEEPVAVPALFAGVVWDSIFDGSIPTIIEKQALVPFLRRQRWFSGKARPLATARFVDWSPLRGGAHPSFLTIVEVGYADEAPAERYVLPLAMASGLEASLVEHDHAHAVLARISGARKGIIYDGLFDAGTAALLLGAIEEQRDVPTSIGSLRASTVDERDRARSEDPAPLGFPSPDQSNSLVIFGKRYVMKLFRRLEPGLNPDVEIGAFLTRHGFTRMAHLVGTIDYATGDDEPASMVMLQDYVWNQGNAWRVTLDELDRYFERVIGTAPAVSRADALAWTHSDVAEPPEAVNEAIGTYLAMAAILGRRTGELHAALAGAAADEQAFIPEPFAGAAIAAALDAMQRRADAHVALIDRAAAALGARDAALARQVLANRAALQRILDDAGQVREGGRQIRCHGDYHLGQVLVHEGDAIVLDFEGEPTRPLGERRQKESPLKDVAAMLRSFGYAAYTVLDAATLGRPEDVERLAGWAELWDTWVSAAFLRAYLAAAAPARILPAGREDLHTLLCAFVIDKALYEVSYELNSRPEWVHIPLTGLALALSRRTQEAFHGHADD